MAVSADRRFSDDELVAMSEHVLYEFEMVEALAKRQVDLLLGQPQEAWRERFGTRDDLHRDWFEINAMLESEVVHARSLTTFLYAAPSQPAKSSRPGKSVQVLDCYAVDWFDEPQQWYAARPKRPELLSESSLHYRVGKEVAHLTMRRATFPGKGPDWPPMAIFTALLPIMQAFASNVDPVRVLPDFAHRVNDADSLAEPTRSIPSRPGAASSAMIAAAGATQAAPGTGGASR